MAAETLLAYAGGRFGPRNRDDIERRQQRLWKRLQARFADCPALVDNQHSAFDNIPIVDVAEFRRRFDDYNTRGLRLAKTQGGNLPGGLEAGFSTGTSGAAPGLFVTSPAERALYIGRIMGKLIAPWQVLGLRRIALCLRASSRLYEGGGVRFFALDDPRRAETIAVFDPQVLIAPSQVLLELAGLSRNLPSLRHLYYGAETLNAVERDFITHRLSRRPDPIYQATEGFLGAPCRLGTLHLNEDALIIEREALGGDRFRPIVTDLLRQTQLVVRLRLDDILRPTTCACGSPLAAVHPVEGRVQDIWRWAARTVFPGEVEARVAPRMVADHRWIATGYGGGVRIACSHDADAPVIAEALEAFGQPATREAYDPAMDYPKRRHVRWAA